MICGHKSVARKWKHSFLAPGGWFRTNYRVTVKMFALHSTKGWRLVGSKVHGLSGSEWNNTPLVQEHFFPNEFENWPRFSYDVGEPGRLLRNRRLQPLRGMELAVAASRHIHPRSKRKQAAARRVMQEALGDAHVQ